MIRRRKPRVKLIDPLNSIVNSDKQGNNITEQKLALVSTNMETIHKTLLNTQNELNEIWGQAVSILNKSATNTISTWQDEQESPGSDISASTDDPESSSGLLSFEQLARHEKELTKQKLEAISAYTDIIRTALAEAQSKLNNIWKQTEESLASAQVSVAPTAGQAGTQAATISDQSAATLFVPANNQYDIPQPVSTSSSGSATDAEIQAIDTNDSAQ